MCLNKKHHTQRTNRQHRHILSNICITSYSSVRPLNIEIGRHTHRLSNVYSNFILIFFVFVLLTFHILNMLSLWLSVSERWKLPNGIMIHFFIFFLFSFHSEEFNWRNSRTSHILWAVNWKYLLCCVYGRKKTPEKILRVRARSCWKRRIFTFSLQKQL